MCLTNETTINFIYKLEKGLNNSQKDWLKGTNCNALNKSPGPVLNFLAV